jgi:2-keto-4-pentenoate hydratase/2-oxohepta-3-ene-1,7-dioic acid hydratase in catechol pathway
VVRTKSLKFARYRHGRRGGYALVEGESLRRVVGTPFGAWRASDDVIPLSQVKLLAPVRPSKVLGVAMNYRSHVERSPLPELREEPKAPEFFLMPPSAIIGPEEAIRLPAGSGRVDYEGELVVVIGRRARGVPPGKALDYVLGYTCGNDVSARDWQQGDLQWWRAKGSDTFAPLGPWLVTGLDPRDLELRTRVNGREVQHTSTAGLIHDVARLVSFASQAMTLLPGDLLYSGTPGSTAPLQRGDVVEVEIDGIGVLRNPVR